MKPAKIDRLGEIVGGASTQRLDCRFDAGMTRDQNDFCGRPRFDIIEKIHPVAIRQLKIDQYHVRMATKDLLLRFTEAAGYGGGKSFRSRDFDQCLPGVQIIVDDEYVWHKYFLVRLLPIGAIPGESGANAGITLPYSNMLSVSSPQELDIGQPTGMPNLAERRIHFRQAGFVRKPKRTNRSSAYFELFEEPDVPELYEPEPLVPELSGTLLLSALPLVPEEPDMPLPLLAAEPESTPRRSHPEINIALNKVVNKTALEVLEMRFIVFPFKEDLSCDCRSLRRT
jgi:hypothetical protein